MSSRVRLILAAALLAGALAGAGLWAFRPSGDGAGFPRLDRRARALTPETACLVPSRPAEAGPSPRCTISFGRAVAALAVPPEGSPAIVSLVHAATGSWALPDARYLVGFAPLPAEEEARAVVASATRDVALFAVGDALLRYRISTGALVDRLAGPGGVIADLAWSADGATLAVAAGGEAYVLAGDGTVTRRLGVDGGARRVAIDAGGRRVAVATDVGGIVLSGTAAGAAQVSVTPSLQPAAALAFAGSRLWVAGSDGTLRALDPASGAELAHVDAGSPLVALAVAADGRRAATAGRDRAIRIHALPAGTVVARLAWHRARVTALAFGAGATLLSGDADGELAVWDGAGAR